MTRHGIRHVAATPGAVVLVCRKCAKKLDGGFGPRGDRRLAKALRDALATPGEPKPKKLRRATTAIIEVDCLKLCPKGAVVVLRGDRPDDWLIVPAGTPVADVMGQLGVTRPSA